MKLLTYKDLVNLQTVFFFDNNLTFKAVDVLSTFAINLSRTFPNDPEILNRAVDKNGRVTPMIIYKSPDNAFGLSISTGKADFIYNNVSKTKAYIPDILDILKRLHKIFTQDLHAQPVRIGVIANYVVPYRNNWQFSLDDHTIFTQGDESKQFYTGWMESINLNDTIMNKWIKYSKDLKNPKNDLVSVDINTLHEENLSQKALDAVELMNAIIYYIEDEV